EKTYRPIRDRHDDGLAPEAAGDGTRSRKIICSHASHANTSTSGRPFWPGKDSKKRSSFPQPGQASKVLSLLHLIHEPNCNDGTGFPPHDPSSKVYCIASLSLQQNWAFRRAGLFVRA